MRLFSGTKWDIPPTCDRCGLDLEDCSCAPEPEPPKADKPPEKQRVRIRKEKRKKGKIVTVVSGFDFANPESYDRLLKELKAQCGTGGTLEEKDLILQGDLKSRLEVLLIEKGYQVRVLN